MLTDELRAKILAHAAECAPAECCGVIVRGQDQTLQYQAVRNISTEPLERFALDPAGLADAEDRGEVLAVVHSHPNASANPSDADRVGCESSGVPWVIVGWPSGVMVCIEPCGWRAPLVGRAFEFGVLDCYALVRDFYARELFVDLPDFARTDRFWLPSRGADGVVVPPQPLYRQHMDEAGFSLVTGADLQVGDVLAMRVRSAAVENHAGVYVGGGRMLHHMTGQLSEVVIWGEAWQRRTTGVGRHPAVTARLAVGAYGRSWIRPGVWE